MKIRQTVRHWAAKRALTTPVIRDIARKKLVELHTRIFLNKADPAHADDRAAHLDAFFDCTIDTYVAALTAGYSEAQAREITHIQANFDFFNHGWTEMMEIPSDELDAHYDRYGDFFESYEITIDDPLGSFRTIEIPDAPATPENLDRPEHPNATGGFADDVYVENDQGTIKTGDHNEPDDVDISQAPGLADTDSES